MSMGRACAAAATDRCRWGGASSDPTSQMGGDTGDTDMHEQELADRAEAEAIARYRAMRETWGTAWGRRPR